MTRPPEGTGADVSTEPRVPTGGLPTRRVDAQADLPIPSEPPGTPLARASKRALDVIVSFVALAALTPLLLIFGFVVKMDTPGPMFFSQERVGYQGRPFLIRKLRTMTTTAPRRGFGHQISASNAHITRSGHWLRRSGLDELPQLWNVLIGEMSLVGPRPFHPWQIDYGAATHRTRLSMRPGITGQTILAGRNQLSFEEKILVDAEYVTKWSFWRDIRILLLTPWVVLIAKTGVYHDEHR